MSATTSGTRTAPDARQHHLAALGRLLDALLLRRDPALAWRAGITPEALAALRWVQRPARHGQGGPAAVLAFADDCGGARLPRTLRSPLDGTTALPVRSVRGGACGQAQSWIRAENATHDCLTGTLGAVLRNSRQPSRLLALTAGHVLASTPAVQRGDVVRFHEQTSGAPSFGGRLFDWQPNFSRLPDERTIDAALVEVEADAVAEFAALRDEWPIGTASPFADDNYRLRTRNRVISGGAPVRLSTEMRVGDDDRLRYVILNALCWTAEELPVAGDSGAPVWNAQDELVAIHAGLTPEGSDRNTVAVPIGAILGWAEAEVVRRGEPLARPQVPRPGGVQPLPFVADRASGSGAEVLARTMWGEARGEPDPEAALAAVAQVVLDRVARQTYWGCTVETVCRKPFQFSCWNPLDPNLPQLMTVTRDDARFALACRLADKLLAQNPLQRIRDDPTRGATHYHARSLSPRPRWARGHDTCASIGHHMFYRDIA